MNIQKKEKGYHKLLVWQKAHTLVLLIYKSTDSFPKVEEFGLKGQLRRASVSVVLTIVEGYRRRTTKDYLHFLNIAETSLEEVEAILELCLDLHFFTEQTYAELENKRGEIAFLLNRLILSIKK